MKTIWKNKIKSFEKLNNDVTCDTLIIGGGIAGLWCAYKLSKTGQKVCVVEANRLGSGVTKGSSAILTYAQLLCYQDLIKKHGEIIAKQYLLDTQKTISEIIDVIKKENIECDLHEADFMMFTTKTCGVGKLKKEKDALKKLGVEVQFSNEHDMPFNIKKGLLVKKSYLIDPLMLLSGLVDCVVKMGGQIYENTMVVKEPDGSHLEINGYKVKAKNFIVATHFPYINFPGFYFFKLYQDQNYIIAFKPNENHSSFASNITYECIDDNGFEYRRVGDNILCLGPDSRVGSKPYHSRYKVVENHLNEYFHGYKEVVRYRAQDCITADGLPYAGRYSDFLDNVYVLTGFNKWGMTNSYLTATVVCDAILKKSSVEKENNIYAPDRNNLLASTFKTIENLSQVVAGWASNALNLDAKKITRIKNNHGAVVKLNGKRVGVFRDNDGKLYVINGTCPHLGCGLTWNKDKQSFDCPCHGSRFDIYGNILNNPAIKKAEKIEVD